MTKAHVSPGLRAKTKPQIEQRSRWDQPENSRPSPQCGQRLRSPRRSAVPINFEREGAIPELVRRTDLYLNTCAVDAGTPVISLPRSDMNYKHAAVRSCNDCRFTFRAACSSRASRQSTFARLEMTAFRKGHSVM